VTEEVTLRVGRLIEVQRMIFQEFLHTGEIQPVKQL